MTYRFKGNENLIMKESRWFVAFFIFLLVAVMPEEATAQKNVYVHDIQYPFLVVSDDTVKNSPVFSDEDFYEYSTSILFEVGKSDIRKDDAFLQFYRNTILPSANAAHLQLRKVFIRGAASPDGSYAYNQQLGKDRSMALLAELRKDLLFQYLTTDTEVNSITEDYGYLCILLQKAGDKDYAVVKKIYDECNGDEQCCKQKLMAAQNGALWKRLAQKYFPQLRAARFILWFSKPDREHAPVVVSTRDTIFVRDTVVVAHQTQINHIGMTGMGGGLTSTSARRMLQELQEEDTDTIYHHPLFAVKSNLLFDVVTLLNGEIEVPVGQRYSVMAEATWPWWLDKKHNKWCVEMGSVGLEARLWFRKWQRHNTFNKWRYQRNAPLHGWFVGAYANCGYYDFQLKKREGSQGEFAGAGISLGFSSYIGRHWRLELSLAGGAAFYKDREYFIEDNTASQPDREQHLWKDGAETKHTWIGPTKAKVSLSYILTRKCKKGGKK